MLKWNYLRANKSRPLKWHSNLACKLCTIVAHYCENLYLNTQKIKDLTHLEFQLSTAYQEANRKNSTDWNRGSPLPSFLFSFDRWYHLSSAFSIHFQYIYSLFRLKAFACLTENSIFWYFRPQFNPISVIDQKAYLWLTVAVVVDDSDSVGIDYCQRLCLQALCTVADWRCYGSAAYSRHADYRSHTDSPVKAVDCNRYNWSSSYGTDARPAWRCWSHNHWDWLASCTCDSFVRCSPQSSPLNSDLTRHWFGSMYFISLKDRRVLKNV